MILEYYNRGSWILFNFFKFKKGITLKVLIFASTNFRENLFSREFIFAIEIFENFAGTYFREFREFKIFRIFRGNLFSRISRSSYFPTFREN